MRKIIVTVILIIICFRGYSQDIITRTNGEVVKCKIQNEDSTCVYFKTFIKDKLIETYLLKSEISSIKYYSKTIAEINTIGEIEKREAVTKAIGKGFDYGGLVGFKLAYNLNEDIEFFGGLGWAFLGFGYNVGIKLNIPSDLKINPFIHGMYGYNTVIINDDQGDNKIFYGVTAGFGLDFKSSKRKNYWTLGLQIPIRTKEARDFIEDKNVELYPISISVGYTF